MKLALISLDQCWEDKEVNQMRCESRIACAALAGADVVVFPELTLTAFTMNAALAEPAEHSESVAFFREASRRHATHIVFGVMLSDAQGVHNALCVTEPGGTLLARYDKAHPFSYAGEDKIFTAGDTPCLFEMMGMRVGLAICYDLRFPAWFQLMSAADIIIIAANWPQQRVQQWTTLLQARAIENQVFVAGVNRVGRDALGLDYKNSSAVFAPDGSHLVPYQHFDDTALYNCDIVQVQTCRNSFPMYRDRRDKLYAAYFDGRRAIPHR